MSINPDTRRFIAEILSTKTTSIEHIEDESVVSAILENLAPINVENDFCEYLDGEWRRDDFIVAYGLSPVDVLKKVGLFEVALEENINHFVENGDIVEAGGKYYDTDKVKTLIRKMKEKGEAS